MPRQLIPHACRTLSFLCVAALTFVLSACGNADAESAASDDRPLVLTTFTVLSDMAENVAGGHLEVKSITKVGAEIHGYEPTPGDIKKASKADLILDNGLNLEVWFSQFLDGLKVPHVVVSAGIDELSITEDAYAGKPNPHAWMSPLNVQIYVENMITAFSALDPQHAGDYRANGDEYKQKLQSIQDELVKELAMLPMNQRALVTCEGAFSYLARDAGLSEKYIWAVNAEQQATPAQIVSAIEYVKANKVPAVFCESTISDAPMRQVVEASGTSFGGTLYVDSLSEANGPVPTYLDLIRHDSAVIIKALTGKNS
ncbi:metal ABC transporter substrate-binding protein [Arthrobacter cryoconiti]|uniref:Metal ABC transporter substrate-binding protein n=1 Tax=Arthrobacter cryoconiti TaxID=748907 RepID=A0ABV8QV80_9MICC|nr:metal ABC transporter substrate-binding protein [Arthrobacter cryoconiti]MCC9069673.1 metal ABC transporter substrate-binding protein [Arthrobacter cryoconiti]